MSQNLWCQILRIDIPRLEAVKDHREANTFRLLLVALLERGAPMTLEEIALRFEEVGIAPADEALKSLKRCRPATPPVYRDGDRYELDPHDDELDLTAFMLDLRPPRVALPVIVRSKAEPLPGPEVPLTDEEIDEAWSGAGITVWSTQRLALSVIDAKGSPMLAADIEAEVARRTRWHRFRADHPQIGQKGSPIAVLPDGRWAIAPTCPDDLIAARKAVRALVEKARARPPRADPAAHAAVAAEVDRQRAVRAAELARQRHAILFAFPSRRPEVAALLDVSGRHIATFTGEEFRQLRESLSAFDVIAAMDVRALMRAIGFDAGTRRLVDLLPPQKTRQLPSGRALELTTELLITGSCRIGKPLGDEKKLAAWLKQGAMEKARDRAAASAQSLVALYQYGRLHGTARLRWRSVDEDIPVPWSLRDEPRLYHLEEAALETGVPLELVLGAAPPWDAPWQGSQLVFAVGGPGRWQISLIDEYGIPIEKADIQAARMAANV